MLRFILNNQEITTDLAAGSTVLDFVRYHKMLKGTKIGCREGDCGACTVLVGDIENNRLIYRSMTSCLIPLGNAQRKHIVTVEGVNMDQLSPVQQAMVDTNGTQCGFCTLGFIMSFTGFVLHPATKKYDEAIAAIDGNICRCTGYKSIERAAQVITQLVHEKPVDKTTSWLVKQGFLPAYFIGIEERLHVIREQLKHAPHSNGETDKLRIGGGTDLVVQKPSAVKHAPVQLLSDTAHLKGIQVVNGECMIGASVTVSEFVESTFINQMFPSVKKFIKLVSSTPIRNMATIAGNLVNASPIGDMTIFFLALDANIILNDGTQQRNIHLKNFYKGYKQLDKHAPEYIEKIIFKVPPAQAVFNFEKVSKRMHLDIASVNSACLIEWKNNIISSIHLSAGGVAPFPKHLSITCEFLQGKQPTAEVLKAAIEIMNGEVSPISDARGTEAYKRLLLRQLFLAHMLQHKAPANEVKKLLLA
ncbi:FAD binding domain-containing protein [Aridibaculum aurantiacum]|uniref:FAD binding domain-containing protein n=1 Tax=Aridibaculum aurantiacum TaxID=2810307 RepID=UPI001A96B6BC|nr:FAD binding domain-containing protein [Aridibaculum aurantiacum]